MEKEEERNLGAKIMLHFLFLVWLLPPSRALLQDLLRPLQSQVSGQSVGTPCDPTAGQEGMLFSPAGWL